MPCTRHTGALAVSPWSRQVTLGQGEGEGAASAR